MHNLNQNIVNYEQLYNKIISLTREKFFYIELNLKDEITKIGKKYNLKTGKFIQRPIIGLVDYHKRNILN